jgi:hypothetical protein
MQIPYDVRTDIFPGKGTFEDVSPDMFHQIFFCHSNSSLDLPVKVTPEEQVWVSLTGSISCTDWIQAKGIMSFVYLEQVSILIDDVILDNDVRCACMGECQSCGSQQFLGLRKIKSQRNRKRQHRALCRLVIPVASYLREMLRRDACFLVTVNLGYALVPDKRTATQKNPYWIGFPQRSIGRCVLRCLS